MAFCPSHGDADCSCPLEPDEEDSPEDQWRAKLWDLIDQGRRSGYLPSERMAEILDEMIDHLDDLSKK